MERLHVRNLVVGAGAVGSAAAYHLARRGEPVLLVERFDFGHNRGSSHGVSRIIRHSYAEPSYARLMPQAYRAWRDLEVEAGRTLYCRTGGISFCPPRVAYVDQVASNLRELGVAHARMDGARWTQRYARFQIPADFDVVFEPDAGVLAADRCVESLREQAERHGAELRSNSPVRQIDLSADPATVVTDTHAISADRILVAAGSWVKSLLPELSIELTPTKQQVLYLEPDQTDSASFGPDQLPVFIFKGAGGQWDDYYGLPAFGGHGVKVARHGGPDFDPDNPARDVDADYRTLIRDWLREYIPSLADARIEHEEVCLYTMADEERFAVSPLPDRPDVFIASACSGHGFKFSCLVGRVLADLAQHGETSLDADWRISR